MSRARSRVSRSLLALLVIVVALGVALYLHNLTKTKTSDAPMAVKAQTAPTPASEAPAPSVQKSPTLSATPAAPSRVDSVALVTMTPTAPPVVTMTPLAAPTTAPSPTTNPSQSREKPTATPWASTLTSTEKSAPLTSNASPDQLLKDGKSKLDAGRLLAARESFNRALASDHLSAPDVAAAKAALAQINAAVVFSTTRFSDDPFGGTYSVQPGDRLVKIALDHDITVGLLKRLNNIVDERKLKAGATIKIIKGPFHAVVDKSDFTLDLYLGSAPGGPTSTYITTYKVGLGKDDSTPTGIWLVEPHKKIINPTYYSPRGEGVIDANDPKNPLGERWIGLTGIDGHAVGKASYGIHGTIEPESIGKMESMGCIRLKNEDVEMVFDLLTEGKSTVTVRE